MIDTPLAPTWVRLAARIIRRMPAGRYRAMNRIHRLSRSAFWMKAPRILGGWSFRCDLRDSIAREVCFTGRYEPQETALIRTLLNAGMTFVDVGANWGYFTLLAAHQVGKAGTVVSLEPDPRLFPVLAGNIAINRLGQVRALQVAAAHEAGCLTLAGFEEIGGNFGLSRVVNNVQNQGPQFQVAARSLDSIFQEMHLGTVDLLKMDIEGAEGWALRGLRETLTERRVRRILLELHPEQLAEHEHDPVELVEKVRQFGYDAWQIDHSRSASRWAAYQERPIDLRRLLRPLGNTAALDHWPHLLLVLKGMEPV